MSEAHTDDASMDEQYGTDPRTRSSADRGPSAKRKVMLSEADAPIHVLAAHGVEPETQTFISDPSEARDYPTTVWADSDDDSVAFHLHQDVREQTDDSFGDFGAAEEDTDDVIWTIVDLCDGSATLTVVGEWSKRRDVPFETLADDYEPLFLADGQPMWGY